MTDLTERFSGRAVAYEHPAGKPVCYRQRVTRWNTDAAVNDRPGRIIHSSLALTPSTRLGPYEITAQIRVGGMGEVYRATDTKLDRDVAIKVLPESLAGDPERIARFQREAKTLAA